jgi:hypothetical protein
MDGHGEESVGYLAVYSSPSSGKVDINGTDVPYLLQELSVDHRFVPVLSSDIKLEEEQSSDTEVAHGDETVNVLALGAQIFAQDVSAIGSDTVAIRRLAPEYGAAMEWGTVNGVDHNWMTIPLAKEYENPVVVVKPVSYLGASPGIIRINEVEDESFDIRFQEWDYLNGTHGLERVFYLVAEAGEHSVAGLTVEAGTLSSSKVLANGWEEIVFSGSFSAPSVFTSVQTKNGTSAVTTRVNDLTGSGFDMTMQEEESTDNSHAAETLGWIAIEKGSGDTGDSRSVEVLSDSTSSDWNQVDFSKDMDRRFPVVISDIITTNGADPCTLRYQNLLPDSIDLFIQEETSVTTETSHGTEEVSIFVAE